MNDYEGWEEIYTQQGEVQSDVLPTVIRAAEIFAQNQCNRILDLGCGTGRHTLYLAKQGFVVFAGDISQTAVDVTAAKAKRYGISQVEVKRFDMREIPYEASYFDGVLCVWTTGHGLLEDNRKTAEEIYRVLKPGGIAVVDYVSINDVHYGIGKEVEPNTFLYNREYEEDIPHHYSTRQEVEELYQKFLVREISPIEYKYSHGKREHTIKAFLVIAQK